MSVCTRHDLDRFLFAPDDLVLIVGQDGLVANVAKYLDGQHTVGINPDPARYDGVLCRHAPEHVAALTAAPIIGDARWHIEARVLAEALCDDGQHQRALEVAMPTAEEARLAWFVREPWPSVATAATLDVGNVDAATPLSIASEMSEGGVIFADGIESDRIEFVSDRRVQLRIAERRVNLVVPAAVASAR